ncbi:hypothetical protein K7G98_29845, partial [Saccharothrix sp. MB29]|nr:hypothetical protein [Saccharothrix sp. MB29]
VCHTEVGQSEQHSRSSCRVSRGRGGPASATTNANPVTTSPKLPHLHQKQLYHLPFPIGETLRKSALSVAVIIACVAVMAMPNSALAAVPGQSCQVVGNAPGAGWSVVSDSGTYYLNWPQHFHINAYGSPDTYFGHGNDKPKGYILRAAINQGTCA